VLTAGADIAGGAGIAPSCILTSSAGGNPFMELEPGNDPDVPGAVGGAGGGGVNSELPGVTPAGALGACSAGLEMMTGGVLLPFSVTVGETVPAAGLT
jgi:hypothetical protein